jgi:hypothetical protein
MHRYDEKNSTTICLCNKLATLYFIVFLLSEGPLVDPMGMKFFAIEKKPTLELIMSICGFLWRLANGKN